MSDEMIASHKMRVASLLSEGCAAGGGAGLDAERVILRTGERNGESLRAMGRGRALMAVFLII